MDGNLLKKEYRKSCALLPLERFNVHAGFDYTKSTEDNYHVPEAPFVGKYVKERNLMDYSYHKRYSESRQLFQDSLIDQFLKTIVYDKKNNWYCESPMKNWIVFTAGVMGAGKGRSMKWLGSSTLFPLEAFVNVDPDIIRHLLPEFESYNEIDKNKTGYLTQKEVGYISEILSYFALHEGKNVLVDGSLRRADWYLKYFQNLREAFPKIKLAILYIDAPIQTIISRANARALVTGRIVPEDLIRQTAEELPQSLAVLSPHVEFYARLMNENLMETYLEYCLMKKKRKGIRHKEKEEPTPSSTTSSANLTSVSSPSTPPCPCQNVDCCFEKQWEIRPMEGSCSQYQFIDHENNREEVLNTWKDKFQNVWEMQCEVPIHFPH